MLDDRNVIAQRDSGDLLGALAVQPQQLGYNFDLAKHRISDTIDTVVFAGMGGSAAMAEFIRTFPQLPRPFVVCRDYRLPSWTTQSTLVILGSYSGSTEETLEVMTVAEEKGALIAVITHGGILAERARKGGYALALIPELPQPRAGVLVAYRALCEVLVAAGLCDISILDDLTELIPPLKAAISSWVPSVPTSQNDAKQLAEHCVGKTPIIYAGPLMSPAAYMWKIGFNENAKNTAWCGVLPEFNHNEFTGWSSHPIEKPFAVIDLLSQFEHPRVLRRFEISDRLLSGLRPKAITVHALGTSPLAQMLYLVLLGEFVSTYVALLNGVNPSPVPLVDKLKNQLA